MKLLRKIILLLFSVPVMTYGSSLRVTSTYLITGSADIKEGTVIFHHQGKQDTVAIINGRFLLRGTVERVTMGTLEIQPSAGLAADVILEPGQVTVTVKNGKCIVGGTANNIRYQQMRDQLAPYRAAMTALQNKSYQADRNEKLKLQASIDSISMLKVAETGKLVRSNANFAGLVILQSSYRKEKPGNLARYLQEFKAFATDPVYQFVAAYYQKMNKIEKGSPVPAFILPDINGKQVSLDSFKGKYVLIDFWYHNCVFCRKMAPSLVKIYADLKEKGLEVIGISVDGKADEQEWRKAIAADGAVWTELWDKDKTLPEPYGLAGYPHLFLLDREGKLQQEIIGYEDESSLRKILGNYIH